LGYFFASTLSFSTIEKYGSKRRHFNKFKKDIVIKDEMYDTVPSGECPSGTRGRIAVFEMFKVDKEMHVFHN